MTKVVIPVFFNEVLCPCGSLSHLRRRATPGVILVSAPAGFGKTALVFAPSCIDIIRGIIKVTIDKMIQRLAGTF